MGIIIFIVLASAAAALYHLGWRDGLKEGLAEGKYLEAQRHGFFYRKREGE